MAVVAMLAAMEVAAAEMEADMEAEMEAEMEVVRLEIRAELEVEPGKEYVREGTQRGRGVPEACPRVCGQGGEPPKSEDSRAGDGSEATAKTKAAAGSIRTQQADCTAGGGEQGTGSKGNQNRVTKTGTYDAA